MRLQMNFPGGALPDRIWSKISFDETSGCWCWMNAKIKGYGVTKISGKNNYVHRLMFELKEGSIPIGHQIDHLCRNPSCVNPYHLEAVTPSINTLRGNGPIEVAKRNRKIGKERTHCKHGHEFDSKNTNYDPDGYRVCITCRRKIQRESQQRKRDRIKSQLNQNEAEVTS